MVTRNGLQKLTHDERDLTLGSIFGTPLEIPQVDFVVSNPLQIKNQGTTDECTAFATAAVLEDTEGVILEPAYIFAKTKELLGEYTEWGANLRDVAKAVTKFGALEKSESPFTSDMDRDFVANWTNWPKDLDKLASKHKQKSYFFVTGKYDYFDNMRANLWRFKNLKRTAITGTLWSSEWNNVINGRIEQAGDRAFGHAFKIFGQEFANGKPYLIAQLSNGEQFGDKGLFYFNRETANLCAEFGALMFIDMPPETAKTLQRIGLKDNWAWLAKALNFLGL